MAIKSYFVSVKRKNKTSSPADWIDQLAKIPGISIIGNVKGRVKISVDERAIASVRHQLGTDFHIEEEVGRSII